MVIDPISDMFNQIMNAQAAEKAVIWIPFSKMKFILAKILEKHHYLKEVKKRGVGAKARLGLTIQYFDKRPAISSFRRISKPGRRLYSSAQDIHPSKGLLIISTSHGLMTGREARKESLGGELFIHLW